MYKKVCFDNYFEIYIFIGFPLSVKIQFLKDVYNSITIFDGKWVLFVWALGGFIIMINVILGSGLNSIYLKAKLRNKKFKVTSNQSSSSDRVDKIIIEH